MDDLVNDIKEHRVHYLILVIILLIGLSAFWFCRYQKFIQVWVVIFTSLAYVAWGAIHHYLDKDLHFKLMLEYLSTAIFGVIIILSLLLRV